METRYRRTDAETNHIKATILKVVEAERPMSVRQVYYQLVAHSLIAKTEREYQNLVGRLLQMRRAGELPYEWLVDNSRQVHQVASYRNIEEALQDCRDNYRRALWTDLPERVEVWCEKDALAGVLWEETAKYDVPLLIARGFASESYLYEAARAIEAAAKPTCIYYFGDFDPSGKIIGEDIERRLRRFTPESDIQFAREAVTREQIKTLRLPTRPTKTGGSHAKNFKGASVDLDAILPNVLRTMVRTCIERHLPKGHLQRVLALEEEERLSHAR